MKKKLIDLLFGEEEKEEYYEEVIVEEPLKELKPMEKKEDIKNQEKVVNTVQEEKKEKKLAQEGLDGLEVGSKKEIISEPKPEPRRISLDIDDLEEKKKVALKAQARQKSKYNGRGEYEFTPVISPIFGADEETDEVTTPNVPKKKVDNKGDVLSPIYGMRPATKEEALPVRVLGKKSSDAQEEKAEKDIVNLTLDEILSRTAAITGQEVEAKDSSEEKIYEEKKVINSRNMSLFDDEQ